jgi:hypothetical protein
MRSIWGPAQRWPSRCGTRLKDDTTTGIETLIEAAEQIETVVP